MSRQPHESDSSVPPAVPQMVEPAFETLSYFDGAVLAPLSKIPTLFSVALMDHGLSAVNRFAAYNRWGSEYRSIEVYPFNRHEGGQ